MRKLLLPLLIAPLASAVPMLLGAADRPAVAPGAGHGYLIDRHVAAGVGCAACHGREPAAAPAVETCLGCHGGNYDRLAAMTAADRPNPHASHEGPLPCSSCHHVHKASVTVCNSCHDFDMKSP